VNDNVFMSNSFNCLIIKVVSLSRISRYTCAAILVVKLCSHSMLRYANVTVKVNNQPRIS